MAVRDLCNEGCEAECNFNGLSCPCLNCLLKVICKEACEEGEEYWNKYFDSENYERNWRESFRKDEIER